MSAGKISQKLGIPIALASASFAFSFLVVELGLRALGFDPMRDIAAGRSLILQLSDHPVRKFELTPNSSGFAWRTQVRINSQGMRDREYPLERTGVPRIVVIGDSVTFGTAVAARHRFTDQLEILLTERLGGPVEVLNFGVGGYDTLQQVATLEDIGLRFAPDLVIVGYCVNDIGDNSPNLKYIRRLRDANARLYQLRLVQLVSSAIEKLRLIQLLDQNNRESRFAAKYRGFIAPVSGDRELMALRDELGEHMKISKNHDFRIPWYYSEAHLGKLAYAFDRLAELVEENSLEVIVAVIPFLGESKLYDVAYRMVEHMASERGLDTVVLMPALSGAGLENLRSRHGDPVHPNERGHRLIAEALEPLVSAKLRTGDRRESDAANSSPF